MMTDNDRPQDVGRRHDRKRNAGSDPLLARYQAALRVELTRLLDELEQTHSGLGGTTVLAIEKPNDRANRWDLAFKLAKELGSAIDPQPSAVMDSGPRSRPRARRVSYD